MIRGSWVSIKMSMKIIAIGCEMKQELLRKNLKVKARAVHGKNLQRRVMAHTKTFSRDFIKVIKISIIISSFLRYLLE